MRFIDKDEGLDVVYANVEDEIEGEGTEVGSLIRPDPNLREYRKRVQRFIRDHQDHITIRRLKNNEPVTQTDITAIEDILFANDGPIPRDDYMNIFGEQPLGVLVRSIVGLDRKAAKSASAHFLDEAPLIPDQIAFLNEVVEYLVKNGIMEPKVMFDTPFTHIHDSGLAGVFGDEISKKVIELVRHINSNADVA